MAKIEAEASDGAKHSEPGDDAIVAHVAAIVASLKEALEEMRPLTKEQEDLLRSHHKAISMVVDLETQLVKRGAQRRSDSAAALDLAAARSEILRRIARFNAASSD